MQINADIHVHHDEKQLDLIEKLCLELKAQGEKIMANEADLKAVLDQLGPALTDLDTKVQALLDSAKAGAVTDADIAEAQAALDAVNAVKTKVS